MATGLVGLAVGALAGGTYVASKYFPVASKSEPPASPPPQDEPQDEPQDGKEE